MGEHYVDVTFVFKCKVKVQAETPKDAKVIADNGFGMTISGGLHSNDNRIFDWEFDSHPEKVVGVK